MSTYTQVPIWLPQKTLVSVNTRCEWEKIKYIKSILFNIIVSFLYSPSQDLEIVEKKKKLWYH